MKQPLTFFAAAPAGLEGLLEGEIRAMGGHNARRSRSGVSFSGRLETAYRVCLWSRTAGRVLLKLAEFPAPTPDALYAGVRSIRWREHFSPHDTMVVDFTASGSRITHSRFGALKVKDAVVDQFREACGIRPSIDRVNPAVRINLFLLRDRAVLSLDLSGHSLHRRGYRTGGGAAPLKENLAAAVLMFAGWPGTARAGGTLLDPMCGSGTIPIEAAFMAGDVAPGLLREYFGFQGWKGHDPETWERLMEEARARRDAGLERLPRIMGCDTDGTAIKEAAENARRAGLGDTIRLERRSLGDHLPPFLRPEGPGLVATNPPYGRRMGDPGDLGPLYGRLGAFLRKEAPGWRAAVLAGNPRVEQGIGLAPARVHPLYNGPIPCRLLIFKPRTRFPARDAAPRARAPGAVPSTAPPSPGERMLANRLRKNLRHFGRWARRSEIDCFRLYDRDIPEYAMAVDIYRGEKLWVHVQEYLPPARVDREKAETRRFEALRAVREVLDVPESRIFFKLRRRQKGNAQYRRMAREARFFEVKEGGLRFRVNLADRLDTGLFLDHRETRELIRRMAAGKRFLNLFGYTGTATVYAAHGGATRTTTVDLSRTHLAWARENLALNGLDGPRHERIRADCLEWIESAAGHGRSYGLIFLDPPTFSNSKRMKRPFDLQKDHADLIRRTVRLLAPGGTLLFSTHFRNFKLNSGMLPDLNIEDITRKTIPPDFARRPRVHQCWKISRRTARKSPDPRGR